MENIIKNLIIERLMEIEDIELLDLVYKIIMDTRIG